MNANRMLGSVSKMQSKSSEKLSSGYKINRAADDAAGLSISEKMRKQVRGLSQGVENTQAGISLCQVADGALAEVHDMLQRMTELSVQSANGTNSFSDRQAIQAEISEIICEVERISKTTKFNETAIFDGEAIVTNKVEQSTPVETITRWKLPSEFREAEITMHKIYTDDDSDFMVDGVPHPTGSTFSITGIQFVDSVQAWIGKGDYLIPTLIDVPENTWGVTDVPFNSLHLSDLKIEETGEIYAFADNGQKWYLCGSLLVDTDGNYTGITSMHATNGINDPSVIKAYEKEIIEIETPPVVETSVKGEVKNIWIQSGCDTGDGIILEIESMNPRILGVADLDVSTEKGADYAIETVDIAIQKINASRSKIGAQQNRLEHTVANENNIVENTTAAESRIRDTDMVEEMVEFSKNNILQQAGQSMLAQANQVTQGVLSLLQ